MTVNGSAAALTAIFCGGELTISGSSDIGGDDVEANGINFGQQGSFGQLVEIAAKVDLTGMDTKNLYFYAYDKATNTYKRIEKPAYWINKNGYLHFTTELAGDIVSSDGPLMPKGVQIYRLYRPVFRVKSEHCSLFQKLYC